MKEQFSYRAYKWLIQRVTNNRNANQINRIQNTNWDILVVLDACGINALRPIATWPVETVVSPASCTPEWLKELKQTEILNNHIITANPQYEKLDIDAEMYFETHWNDRLSTVLPEAILERANEIAGDDENVVVHLQQPHWPYVAKFGDSWKLAYTNLGPWTSEKGVIDSVQVAMARGYIDVKMAKQAYLASVKSVWSVLMPYINQWHDESLTTVVTADHGETFGRFRDMKFYEHPCKCHIRPLTHVPWVKMGPQKEESIRDSTVDDRLKALGYAE